MRYLLDTKTITSLFKQDAPNLNQRVRACQVSDIGLSVIVAHELFYGAFKSQQQGQHLQRVEQIGFPLVPLDWEAARAAGEIRALLAQGGQPIGPYDTLIAGQALSRDLILVSSNIREFGRVPWLVVEDWIRPDRSALQRSWKGERPRQPLCGPVPQRPYQLYADRLWPVPKACPLA